MKKSKHKLPVNQIRAMFGDSSVNEESRTVDLVWTTGSKGLRRGWDGPYYEELSLDPSHVDLTRLQDGAPLLAAHDDQSLDSVIGVVERVSIENGEGVATVRFAKDEASERIFQKVKDRILRNVSVGYSVQEYTDVTQDGEEIPTYRATRWQPAEISIVPIGFDSMAKTRTQDQTESEVEVISRSEQTQEVNPLEETLQMSDTTKPLVDTEALKQEAIKSERQRASEIKQAVRSANLEDTLAEDMIARGVSADEARKEVIAKLAEQSKKTEVNNTVRVDVGGDNSQALRKGFEDAMLHRADSKNFSVTEESKLFLGKGLLRAAELIIPRYSSESDSRYATRAMSSSDLPLALANIAEKGLQKQYELQPRTFESWTSSRTLRNYKEHSQVKSGDFGSLVERKEGGEFQESSFGEKNEVVQLKDYGVMHSFTSQMLVNDDMSVIARIASQSGIAASRLENSLAYSALTTNKTMKDGIALYHASHGNLGTAGAIATASVAEAYKLMRKQTSTDGRDKLNLAPTIFVCGPDKEHEARQFFASVNAQQTSNVNIYSGAMQVIVDAELSGNQYYFLANPSVIDTIVCFRLEGKESPQVESRIDWSTNSLQLKVAHSFAAAPMDWRGIVKNAGN